MISARLIASLCALIVIQPAEAASEPAALTELHELADARNLDLVAARSQVDVAQAGAAYAGSLEAPHLNLSVMNVPSLSGPSLTLSQGIPGGGKRQLMAEVAAQQVEMARQEYERQRLIVLSEVTQAFYEIAAQDQAIQIHHLIHGQLVKMQKVVTTRYAVGSGLLSDAIRAQLEITKLHSSQFALEQKLSTGRAKLNRLVNRPLDTPIATAALTIPTQEPDEATLIALAEARNPTLRSIKTQVAAAESQRSLTQQDTSVPDFDVGVQVGRSMPGDMGYVGGMIGMSLPWLAPGRFQQRSIEAERILAANQARYQAQVTEVRYRIRKLLSQLIQNKRQIDLSRRGLIPQSEQAVDAALAAYRVGKADFTTVIEGEKAVFEARMDDAMALGEFNKTWAMLEEEIGGSISQTKEGKP